MSSAPSLKDPFSILADEITLLRGDIKNLQRTSLNKDEAKTLNSGVAKSVSQMVDVCAAFDGMVDKRLRITRADLISQTKEAASSAATAAIQTSHSEIMGAARIYAKNAGEARREAWRYFGGFWVWLTSIGLLGAILGGLGMFWLKGRETAEAFGQHPSLYCSSAGGVKGKLETGKQYCVFYLN